MSLPGSSNNNSPATYPNKPGFPIPCNAASSLYSRKHSTATAATVPRNAHCGAQSVM